MEIKTVHRKSVEIKRTEYCIRINQQTIRACQGTALSNEKMIVEGKPYVLTESERYFWAPEEIEQQSFQEIYGFYTVLLWHETENRMEIIRSPLGETSEWYYAFDSEGCVISNRLALLISERREEPQMADKETLDTFKKYGFLPENRTLVKGVEKVPPGTRCILNLETEERACFCYEWIYPKEYTEEEAVDRYESCLAHALKTCWEEKKNLAVTLSSGFDSNYLLHLLRKETELPIHAYSIGGKRGRDETAAAGKIASLYSDVTIHTDYVTEQTLEHLPDIVWALEGGVYERGIFLQYVLAELLSQCGEQEIIEGDGADQVMRRNYKAVHGAPLEQISHVWREVPDYALKYIVLPKNRKLLASRGLEASYPYLDIEMLACLKALQERNGEKKQFHAEKVKEAVAKEIRELLKDQGGATNLSSLSEQFAEDGKKENEMLCQLYLEVFEHLFIGKYRLQYQHQSSCDLTLTACIGKERPYE